MEHVKAFIQSPVRLVYLLLFLCTAVGVFYFSADSRVRALSLQGNYYYSSREIFQMAGIDSEFRIWTPSWLLKKRLEASPFIEKAEVFKSGQNLDIAIQEIPIIGFYEKDGAWYVFTRDGNSILLENTEDLASLLSFPRLVDLSETQLAMLVQVFSDYPEDLSRNVMEKVAEILPWEESFDPNMVRLVMQDGNEVFGVIAALPLLSNYQALLPDLEGEDVCLFLDEENSVIVKYACDYMYMTSEERDAGRTQLKKQLEYYKQQQEDERVRLEEAQKKAEEEARKKAEEEARKKEKEQAAQEPADKKDESRTQEESSQAKEESSQEPDSLTSTDSSAQDPSKPTRG